VGGVKGLLGRIFSYNERELARYRRLVADVNVLEPRMRALSDGALAALTPQFRRRLRAGETLDAVLPEAYAAVREAARRVLGERPFDVQVIGAIALHEGRISEMKTGEGKTLTATMPLYLNALAGRGVHLVTTNDFLVRWQAQWMGQVYQFLGLTVGFVQHDMPSWVRTEMYGCDVTYVQNSELGFDYLRDNMALDRDQLVLRDLYYAIVDEVDSILIDEARTPLILSGPQDESTDLYRRVNDIIARLSPGKKDEDKTEHGDYIVDEKLHTVHLTEQGQTKVEKALGIASIAQEGGLEIQHHVQAALKAHTLFHRDKEYIVKDGEVIIVDEFTGHLQPGRRYSDGIHQAIEAKEGVVVREEQQTVATITYQNFFRLYDKLAGMTGTAKTEEAEFQRIYNMPVIVVPPNKPVARTDFPDVVYKTQEAKFRGIISDIARCKTLGQPVLVGTRNVDVSELIARRLLREKVQLLALVSLCQDEILRRKDLPKADREEWIDTLRLPLDEQLPTGTPEFAEEEEEEEGDRRDRKRARKVLTQPVVAKIARALGIPPDPTEAGNLDRLLDIWGIASNGATAEERSTLAARLSTVLQEDRAINPLNAKFHAQEAQVITEAGRAGYVTIATNMAGRGVDIRLGGAPEPGEDRSEEYAEVKRVGGLHVVGTERHESRRIDNQLRGRSGRQGDPGSSRFYVSLEDELMRIFAPERMRFFTGGWPEEEPVETRLITRTIERAQYKVEVRNFGMRKHTLQYDNVMNEQRTVVYANRRRVLMGESVYDSVAGMADRVVEQTVRDHADPDADPGEWTLEDLCGAIRDAVPGLIERFAGKSLRQAVLEALPEALEETAAAVVAEDRQWFVRVIERAALQAAADYRAAGGSTVQGAIEGLIEEVDALAPGARDHLSAAELAGLDEPGLDEAILSAVRQAQVYDDGAVTEALRSRLRRIGPASAPAQSHSGLPDAGPAGAEAATALSEVRIGLLQSAAERIAGSALSEPRREALGQALTGRVQALQQERNLAQRLAQDALASAMARVFTAQARLLYEDERVWHDRTLERRLREAARVHTISKSPAEDEYDGETVELDAEALRRDAEAILSGLGDALTEDVLAGVEPHEVGDVVAEVGLRIHREREEAQAAQRLGALEDRVESAVRSNTRTETPPERWDLDLFFQKVGEAEGDMRSALAQEALRRVRNSRLSAQLKDPAAETYTERATAVQGPWGLRRRFALDTLRAAPPGQLIAEVKREAHELYEARTRRLGADAMAQLERSAMLRAIEASWPQHLQDMEHLREAVLLRAYGQWDPLVQYQKEGYEYFQKLMARIAEDVTKLVYGSEFVMQPTQRRIRRSEAPAAAPAAAPRSGAVSVERPAPDKLPKPNQRCWCGSGRKYKNCHMEEDLATVARH
jgi:preprotein translocase subunit SecA